MRFNRHKNTAKKTGATLGFKTGIRGRKLLRKQKRQLKKQNRASFAARLRGNNTGGTKQPQTEHSKIKQLQAVAEAEKAKLKVKKSDEAAEEGDSANEDSWESVREEVDGFQPSTASTSERMARLQEFVNREAGVSEAATSTKTPEDSEKGTDEKTNLIKDKKKLKLLRNEQKEDTKEINKLARLMRMSKPQKKKVAPIFAEDFGSLLRDIEEGTMSHADKYKGEEGDDKAGESDKEFERDMAAALGQNLGKKKKKVKIEVEKEDKSKKKVKKMMSAGNMDPENEFRASDFNICTGGNVSDDEAEEEDYEYEDEDFFDDTYGDEVYSERRKQGKSSVTGGKNIDGDDGEGDESKFSSDGDGEELYSDSKFTDDEEEEEEEGGYSNKIGSERRKQGKPSVIRKNIDGDEGEFNESKFSSDDDEEEGDEYNDSRFSDNEGEEDSKYEDEYDVSKFSDDDGDEENVEEEEVDDMNGYFDSEAEEDDTRAESELGEEENIEEEEEGDENGFIDSQAEEDSEVDEESDGDGELVHDIRKEEDYAFEGGSGYYSKPEILKNGMENDIDRYSSNSDDDVDLEGFVIDDNEVEYENVSDELPDELSDSPSPVRKRKKTRIVMQSDDDESEGKEKDQDESDRDSEGKEDREDFFFSARGWKNRAQEAVGGKESLGARKENEGKTNALDTTSEESNDEDEADGKMPKEEKMKTKEKDSNTKKRKLVIEDESDIMNSSPEKTSPKVKDQENDNIPQIKAKKMKLGEDEGDTATAHSEGNAQTEKKMKVEKISEDDSTMDSLVNTSMLKVRKMLEDENDADVSTGDSKDTRRLVKAKKKKKKKLEEKVTDDSTMDDDISQIITKKKKTMNLDENVEGDSKMGDDILQVGAKKKKTKKSDENDDSTMDGDASEVGTKKKKTRKLDEDAADDSTMDERASETSARKKKTRKLGENDADDSTMDDNLPQIIAKKKKAKKPGENDADDSTMDDDASQISTKKKKGKKYDGNDADESTVNSEDTSQTKTKKKKKKRGLKDEPNDDSTVDSEDVASARNREEKDETPAGMLVVDSEDSSPIRTKKTGKRKLEEESNEDNSTVDSDDAQQTKLKKKKKKIEEENEVAAPKGKQSSGEEEQKTTKTSLQENKAAADRLNERKPEEEKAATSRKIIPLPEITSSDEEEDEEEVEEEEEEVEEEEDDDEDEEEEGDMEEEEEDITDRSDLEEEEEEEEEKDEEEEDEEGERREKNQNQDNATQRQKNNSDSEDTLTEDIYGRLRDKHGNIVTRKEPEGDAGGSRYIPPALRKLTALNQSKEKRQQLAAVKRTLKGLINRLAESNMGGIASEIEGMYTKHSRNDVNEVLTSLLMEAVVGPTLTPERLVQELALLVALLSANVGSEVGAHILNEFVLKWSDSMDQHSRLSSKDEIGSKELDNITLFVVHLYAFRVVEARLIYDVLHRLAQGFSEKEVELILLVLRSVGFNLRKDDPLALKAVITQIQARAAETQEKATVTVESRKETTGAGTSGKAGGKEAKGGDEGTEYSRITFMLETIQAVRNNNMSKLPNYDPTHMDHLRQVLRGLVRKGRQPAQLNVTLDDMLKARECGRWWVVGSAWSGGLIDEKARQNDEGAKKQKNVALEAKFSDAFMRKAAKLQLSRPPRINILYVLTEGSEDYLDAFEKLLQLSIPQQQEREVFSVILLCCQKGKMFNPFFSHLTDRMCKFDKKYARLLQFALWDKFEEVEAMKVREVANLAKFVTHLIAETSLSLTIFKNISFMDAERQMISLIRQVIISLLLHPAGSEMVERTFSVLSASPKLKILRQSLRIFILKFIKTKKSDEDTNYAMLARRIETAVEILGHGGGVRL